MRFAEMTWPMVRDFPRDRSVVVAPIAACEQHALHLPTFTDTLLVTAVAEGAEQRRSDRILLLPTQWLGASHHHLRFGGTLSASVGLHVQMLVEMLTPILDSGFRRVLVLNGHGGNIDTMHAALRELHPRFSDRFVSAACYWDLAAAEFAAVVQGERKTMGHACEMETSMIMALRPELVKRDRIRDDGRTRPEALRGLYVMEDLKQMSANGCVGHPELATPQTGRKLLDAAVARTLEVVDGILAAKLPLGGD